jgi:hypothetical protein
MRNYRNSKELVKFSKNQKNLGFLRKQIIMSILAECQPFACHSLGETRAKTPASRPPAMG